jgi:hypothetical protein
VPVWLAERMAKVGTAIVEHIIWSYGISEFLARHQRSILVSSARMRHGSGLAFFRNHHIGNGRPEAWNQCSILRFGNRHLWRSRPPLRSHSPEVRIFGKQTGLGGDNLARTSRLAARVDKR